MYEVGLNFLPKPQKEGKIFLMPIWDYNYTQVQIFLIINDHRNVTNSCQNCFCNVTPAYNSFYTCRGPIIITENSFLAYIMK